MQRDYPKLEGKQVLYTFNGIKYHGIVTGCNYDIGITVSSADDKSFSKHLICILGPMAPNRPGNHQEKKYDILFKIVVNQIETGIINVNTCVEKADLVPNRSHELSDKDCAFAQ
jgi:hypothetical protein